MPQIRRLQRLCLSAVTLADLCQCLRQTIDTRHHFLLRAASEFYASPVFELSAPTAAAGQFQTIDVQFQLTEHRAQGEKHLPNFGGLAVGSGQMRQVFVVEFTEVGAEHFALGIEQT